MTLLDKAKRVFGDVTRPEHFTNHTHCCECAEHDATLKAHTPESIGLEELGSPAWDPMCFATDQAFKYYFPAMTRLAVEGSGHDYYLDQFLFHLISDGARNRRWASFTREQRRFVVEVLTAVLHERGEEVERNFDADALFQAIEIWSDDGDLD